jgi:hypothetical protein
MTNRTAFALIACIASLAVGCATERATRGELRATASLPPGRALEYSRVKLLVQEGRIVGEGVAGRELEASLGEGGCVLATSRGRAVRYCPAGSEGSARVFRNVDAAGTRIFTVSTDANGLVVDSAGDHVVMSLKADSVGAELRRHPELIATAFAERFMPSDKEAVRRSLALVFAPRVDPRVAPDRVVER